MFLYRILRPLLFALPPELAHSLTLKSLACLTRLGFSVCIPSDPIVLAGLTFPNRVGLAAGLDKNGQYLRALEALGFGFIEVGTITPKPQIGNPKPRLFRSLKHHALLNRMGFNNQGVDALVARLKHQRETHTFSCLIGVNIGKNADTPLDQALQDYQICFERVYPYADYITLNISSPNTQGLQSLQAVAILEGFLKSLVSLRDQYEKFVPLFVKIAPDLEPQEIQDMAHCICQSGIDGVIATNTTQSREGDIPELWKREKGGISGAPLLPSSAQALKTLCAALPQGFPVIAVGGISCAQDAIEKREAGASLIQLYTGLVFQGVGLIAQIGRAFRVLPLSPQPLDRSPSSR